MQLNIVEVPSIQNPIQPSPGFAKKMLSDYKLDACGLCGYGCSYCSSNVGNYLRINRRRFADLTEQQIGQRVLPAEDPSLMFVWPDYLERLTKQLDRVRPGYGAGQTLVFSMLTDGFSPHLVKSGITKKSLQLVLEKTDLRIRILTKNAIVGTGRWIDFFADHPGRFVVGLSIGSLDDQWARQVEIKTPVPSARLRAHKKLQDAGIPTFGMLCPIFPDVLANDQLEHLVDQIGPDKVEHVWAEPFNDRQNWKVVREGYRPGSFGYQWMTDVYEKSQRDLWSKYATDLYVRLRDKGRREGWIGKLRYLLYEDRITEEDAKQYKGLEGVLLQCKPGADGKSTNPYIAALQD